MREKQRGAGRVCFRRWRHGFWPIVGVVALLLCLGACQRAPDFGAAPLDWKDARQSWVYEHFHEGRWQKVGALVLQEKKRGTKTHCTLRAALSFRHRGQQVLDREMRAVVRFDAAGYVLGVVHRQRLKSQYDLWRGLRVGKVWSTVRQRGMSVERTAIGVSSPRLLWPHRAAGLTSLQTMHYATLWARYLHRHQGRLSKAAETRIPVHVLWPASVVKWRVMPLGLASMRVGKETRTVRRWFVAEPRTSMRLWVDHEDGRLWLAENLSLRLRAPALVRKRAVRDWAIGKVREIRMTIKGGVSPKIGASLWLPRHPRPKEGWPGLVLYHGSGSSDRDGNTALLWADTFRKLAQILASRGIAVLSFDKAGAGETSASDKTSGLNGILKNAEAVLRFAQNHRLLNAKRLSLLGHSEGGMIAPILALRYPQIRSVVMLGGPVRGLLDVMEEQGALIAKQSGADARELRRLHAMLRAQRVRVVGYIKRMKAIMAKHRRAHSIDATPEALVLGASMKTPSQPRGIFSVAAMQAFLHANRRFRAQESVMAWVAGLSYPPPLTRIKKLSVPTLMLFGGADLQVPAESAMKKLRTWLPTQGRHHAEVWPSLDHFFVTNPSRWLSMYLDPRRSLDDRVIARIETWLRRHDLPGATSRPSTHPKP